MPPLRERMLSEPKTVLAVRAFLARSNSAWVSPCRQRCNSPSTTPRVSGARCGVLAA